MTARSAAAKVLKGASAARTFASTSAARLPPKPNSAAARFAKAKQQAKGEEDGASAGGSGNVLAEVTLPKPDLSSLQVMHPEGLNKAAVGEVKAFPGPALDAFKALSIPGSLQRELAFTPRPATVVREATLKVTQVLDTGKKGSSSAARYVLTGGAGSGKSTLLLQAVSYAQSTDWIVLYLPSAAPLVNSSTPHIYSSARALFDQPALSSSLLSKFSSANSKAFKALKTAKEWTFGDKKVAQGKSLEDLAKAAGGDEKLVTSVFEAVMEELSVQKQRPVLLAIDDAQPLFTTSHYVDPSYHAVETFSLAVPRLLLEFVSGQRSFAQGSVLFSPCSLSKDSSPAMTDFLASSSASATSSPASSSSLATATAALASPYDHKSASSYETYKAVLDSGVKKLEVPERLSRQEAVGIVRLLKGWRGTREAIDDKMFLQRLVASDGNAREFARSLVKTPAL
ncbi:hypothetical protein JCM6882_000846 [Rhodosporidiobolus microsporus]